MQTIVDFAAAKSVRQKLTVSQLTGNRWSFGPQGQMPASSTFFFSPEGRFEGYRHPNEDSWRLEHDVLTICDTSGAVTWRFRQAEAESSLVLFGTYQKDGSIPPFVLRPVYQGNRSAHVARLADNSADDIEPNEDVRLLIWDLDDTFWSGTLSEGEVIPLSQNIAALKALASRGIVNSICSKNHFEAAKAKLVELGVWDYFVFSKIQFDPKGPLIQEIIAASSLRAASVLFVDDKIANLEEAAHLNPGLQVSLPDLLPTILEDHRFRGKPDPAHDRLKRYKLLESKIADRKGHALHGNDFLVQSDIRVSFHYDVLENFDRIHELVNRTNQLNFTKIRWPEDKAEAKETYLSDMAQSFHSQSAYVKVSDRYGSYGISGFYLEHEGFAKHFLFSCRSMNMGVEQFVWKKLRRPQVTVSGETASDFATDVDWISVTEDADLRRPLPTQTADGQSKPFTICIRGACDLEMAAHYLQNHGRLVLEYPYPYQGWAIAQTARAVVASFEAQSIENQALLAGLPGMPINRFDTSIADGSADLYVLSFSQECFASLYRSRSTDLVLPIQFDLFPGIDITSLDYERVIEQRSAISVTRAQWEFLRSELTYVGAFDKEIFRSDLLKIFIHLTLVKQKTVVVLMLNDRIGQNKWLLSQFGEVNAVVRSAVDLWNATHSLTIKTIELNDILRGEEDLTEEKGGAHFKRDIYRDVSDRISALVKTSMQPRRIPA